MKFKRDQKVVLLCVRNVYGIDFNAVFGILKGVRRLKWGSTKVVQVEVRRWLMLGDSPEMKGKVIELPLDVWVMRPLTDETKAHVLAVREASLELGELLLGWTPLTKAAYDPQLKIA